MAPKALKRPAAANTLSGSTKRSRDQSGSKCAEIVKALRGADTGLPEDVMRMLIACAEPALRDFKDLRHAYQEEAVSWLSSALKAAHANLSQKVESTSASLGKCQEEQQARESTCKAAEDVRDKASCALDEATAAGTEAAKDVSVRNKALNEAKKAQTRGDSDVQAMSKKKQVLETVVAGVYAELKGNVAKKKTLDSFVKTLKAENADEALLKSVPAAFAKPPSERSEFDTMVQTQLEDFFARRIMELTSQMDAGAAGVAERASAVEAASGAVEQARQAEEAAGARANEATNELKAAEQALKATGKAKKEFMPTIKEAESKNSVASEELKTFSEGPMAAFAFLRDRTTPAPEPEPAPEEALAQACPDLSPAEAVLEA